MKIITTSLLLFASLTFPAAVQSAQLIHNPALTAAIGQPVPVSAVLSGADPSTRVRLYYRVKGKEQYSSVQMGGSPSQVTGEIPAKAIEMPGVEYFIEATLNSAVVASSPAANYKMVPHFITVRKDESKPELSILSPMEGDTVDTAQPVITVSYEDADSGLDLGSVLVKIDGIPVKDSGHIQALDTLMSYVPSADIAEGKHEAVVLIKDKSGNIGAVSWAFSVKSKISSKQEKGAENKFHWDGSVSYETLYGYVAQQPANYGAALPYRPYGVNRAHLEVNGRGETDTYQLKVYKTDEERMDQQASDRYTLLMKSDEGIIALGDYSPSFSTLSLYNPYFFRGVTLDLRSGDLREGHTRLMGVWGQTQRPVEAGSSGFSGAPASAAFGEYLYGTRWEYGGKYFVMGMNMVTVNDDGASVSNPGSLVPKYSGVGTTDVQIKVPQIYLGISGEYGADYYLNGPTILGVNAGTAYRAGMDVNVLPVGSHVSFDWKDMGGSFGYVPGGFTTMANPGLLPDYRGYESSVSQSLLDGQLGISVNLNGWHDNLNGTKDLSSGTTENDYLSVFGTLALNKLPYLNLGVTQNLQKNDLNPVTNPLLPATNNASNTFNVGLGYTRPINEITSLSGNFSYMNIAFRDKAALRLGQDMDNNNFVLSAFLTHGGSSFSAAASLGFTSQPGYDGSSSFGGAVAPARTGSNDTVSMAWIQRWIPRVFDSRVSYDLASNHFENPAAGFVTASSSDVLRNTLCLGGNYTLKEVHRFGLSLAYAAVGISGTSYGVSSSDAIGELLTDFNYNFTF